MTDSRVVQLEDVRRVFEGTRRTGPRTAIDGATLSIDHGSWTALLGPNGSGKSTLLRIIATLDQPTDGHVQWFGDSRLSLPARRARLGVVLQTTSLDPLLTGRENLRLQGAIFGFSRSETDERIGRIVSDFGVADRLDDRVGALSGGLARRVDLARAVLTAPALLLLDEPTAGLDPPSREQFLDLIARQRAASGMTVIMSTHLMEEAERADRVAMMDQGRIVAIGSPNELRTSLSNGAVTLRAPVEAAAVLQSCGLTPSNQNQETIVTMAANQNAQLAQVVSALTERGFPVRVGAPTLEDVFLEMTGRSLRASESAS